MLKSKKIILTLCYGIVFFFFLSVLLRMLTQLVFVEKMGMNNFFTKMVLGQWVQEDEKTNDAQNALNNQIVIDWKALYPFDDDEVNKESKQIPEMPKKETYGVLDKWENKISSYKSILQDYTTDNLIGYDFWVEVLNKYEAFIGWNISVYSEYNSVINLGDGYFVEFMQRMDVSENIDQTVKLSEYCKENGIDFLYVQAPGKISKYDDSNISGSLDFTNQNADQLIQGLRDNNINFLDLREEIEKENFVYRDLFYNSDHHWRAETGLWAAGEIAETLSTEYGYPIDSSMVKRDNFTSVLYENCFLGSSGKKVTLSKAQPDDMTLFYPVYETSLHYTIPSKGFEEEGDFNVSYDMSQIETVDYYNLDPYSAYNQGENTVIKIHNNLVSNGKKILIIKDSYVNVVAPFLALMVEDIELLDIRSSFQGSVKKYIEECKPDMVMVLYCTYNVKEIDWRYHTAPFDFR